MVDSVFFANSCREPDTDGLSETDNIKPALMAWHDRASYDTLAGDIDVAAHHIAVDDLTTIGCAGPATLSLSIILDGSFSFELDDGYVINAIRGSAILYCAANPSTGKDILKPDQKLSLVDLRYGHDRFGLAGQTVRRRTGSHWPDGVYHQHGTTSVLVFKAPPRLMSLARDISRFPPNDPLRPLFLQARALDAYVTVVSLLKEQHSKRPDISPIDISRIKKVMSLLDDHYSKKWTISKLARSAGISDSKLKIGFKYVNGTTIHSYLRETRIKKAKIMLEQGLSVTHVAFATGFSSPSHLTKCFKAMQGVSPSRYAKILIGVRLDLARS